MVVDKITCDVVTKLRVLLCEKNKIVPQIINGPRGHGKPFGRIKRPQCEVTLQFLLVLLRCSYWNALLMCVAGQYPINRVLHCAFYYYFLKHYGSTSHITRVIQAHRHDTIQAYRQEKGSGPPGPRPASPKTQIGAIVATTAFGFDREARAIHHRGLAFQYDQARASSRVRSGGRNRSRRRRCFRKQTGSDQTPVSFSELARITRHGRLRGQFPLSTPKNPLIDFLCVTAKPAASSVLRGEGKSWHNEVWEHVPEALMGTNAAGSR